MSSPVTQRTASESGAGLPPDQGLPPSAAAPPKQRRRPALIGLGIALIALGGLGAAWLATSVSDTVSVIAVRQNVARGEVIEADDLTTADINADPGLAPLPASQASAVIGQYAAIDLVQGSLLTPQSTTSSLVPGDGEALVGVAVTAAQIPSEPLRPGDVVQIVDTPLAQADPPSKTPAAVQATVVRSVLDPDSGQRTVDVVVPADRARDLAARVATGRILVILMSRAVEAGR